MAADCSFERALPRLVERLNDIDVEILPLAERKDILDDARLVDRRWQRTLTHASGAWPTNFANQHFLCGESIYDLTADRIDMRSGIARRNRKVLPVRQYMNGDEIDCVCHIAIAQPEFPNVSIGHRNVDAGLDRTDGAGEVDGGHVAAQQDLIADDN